MNVEKFSQLIIIMTILFAWLFVMPAAHAFNRVITNGFYQDGNYYMGFENHTFKILPNRILDTEASHSLRHIIGETQTETTQQIYNSILHTIEKKGELVRNWYHLTDVNIDYDNIKPYAVDTQIKMIATSPSPYANTKVDKIEVALFEFGHSKPSLLVELNPRDIYLYFNQERHGDSPGIIKIRNQKKEQRIKDYIKSRELELGLTQRQVEFSYHVRFLSAPMDINVAHETVSNSRMSMSMVVDPVVFRYGLSVDTVTLLEKLQHKIQNRSPRAAICANFFQLSAGRSAAW